MLDYIAKKYNIDLTTAKSPIQLPISRNEMIDLFVELKLFVGAEVGIERGLFSEVILNAHESMELFCVDPLEPYPGYREHVSKDKMDGFYNEVLERLQNKNAYIYRNYSMDAVHFFNDESLDFVYIDANHDFLNTTMDIAEWSKKVKKGGIIAGHDFTRNKKKDYQCHVKDVVQGWTYAYGIKPWFITSDKSPSYFWIKL